MKLLDWGPHSKWLLAGLGSVASVCVVHILWTYGVKIGVVDYYAWLNLKVNAIHGFTQNPGYWFLIIHTALLGTIAAWCIKNWRK